MKKAFKIIIPIVLVIAVIISIGWYLFEYDREFTRDFLLTQARLAEERGNHGVATWIYNLTYRQSGEDEDVAIELADQFKSMGNYTKAEYTLSNAIADGGSSQLYIALCKTYIEQDKLLDAVTMLDNIADESIKAELDAMRPAAPTAAPESGYYNQYISPDISSPNGKVYISTSGEYPSQKSPVFTGNLTLSGGETTIYALCVGDNGLVSKLSVFSYTIAGVIEEVTLADPALDQIVRRKLSIPAEQTLYSNQLWTITDIEITDEVTGLSDLAHMPFLEKVSIAKGSYENLTAISALNNLRELHIDGVTITSDQLTTIGSLPKLQSLTLSRCNLSSISGIESAAGLTYLDLNNNTLRDLSPLSSLQELKSLNISNNAITELKDIAVLDKLEELDVSFNSLTSTAELAQCTSLKILRIGNNKLTQLDGLEKLTSLNILSAEENNLSNINHLSNCGELTELFLSNNALTDLAAVSSLPKLSILDFSRNQVAELPRFISQDALSNINGSYNLLTSLDALRGQTNLNYVTMEGNAGIQSILPLRDCFSLIEVNVYATGVTDVSALDGLDIIVHYSTVTIE